jgi:O-antigen/teichoic acid export membrane protein
VVNYLDRLIITRITNPEFARRDCPFAAEQQTGTIMSVATPLENPSGTDSDKDRHFRTDHLSQNLGRRSARGGAVTIVSQGLKFCTSMAGTVVLARLLTPQDYGLIGMVAIVINFVSLFQYLGLSTATVKWDQLNHQQVSTLFWLNMMVSTLIMLMTGASAPVLAWFYGDPRLIAITFGYAISILFTGLSIQHEAILSRQMRFGALAIIDISSLVCGLIAALFGAWYGAGYWALVLSQLVTTLVRVVGTWTACRWRPGLPVRGSGVRTILSYGGNLTGFNLINFFSRNLDNALIGRYWGSYQLGLYAKAYQMLLLPMEQINAPIAAVAVPALSRLANSPERYRSAYLNILEKIAMITMPGIALMIATSDWLVLLLLGSQWREAGGIFMLLGLAAIIQPVTRTVLWLFTTQGRPRELLKWGAVSGGISVIAIIAGLPWGATGVAASYAAADLCISTPLLFWYVGRKGPVRTTDFYRTIMPSICAAASTLSLLFVLRPWLGFFSLFVRLVLAAWVTFGVSLLVFRVLPAGRRALQSFAEMVVLIKNRKNESIV